MLKGFDGGIVACPIILIFALSLLMHGWWHLAETLMTGTMKTTCQSADTLQLLIKVNLLLRIVKTHFESIKHASSAKQIEFDRELVGE